MKRAYFSLFIILSLILTGCSGSSKTSGHAVHAEVLMPVSVLAESDTPAEAPLPADVPTSFFIVFHDGTSRDAIYATVRDMGGVIVYDYASIGGMAVQAPMATPVEESMKSLRETQGVMSVELDRFSQLRE